MLIEILLVLVSFFYHISVKRKEMYILIVLVILQIMAYVLTSFGDKYNCFDIHRLFLMTLMIYTLFLGIRKAYITTQYFEKMLSTILAFAVISTFYNLWANRHYILSLDLSIIMYYTDKMKGIFLTRSNYCYLLCIGIAICFFRFKRNKFIYSIMILILGSNILLTNARTSILAIIGMVAYESWSVESKNKRRQILLIILSTLVLFILPWRNIILSLSEFSQKYYLLFSRVNGGVVSGRFDIWKLALNDTSFWSFFIGHGIGSKDAYLNYINAGVGSFHSLYVDLFYEGGIAIFFVLASFLVVTIRKVKRSKLSFEAKKLIFELYIVSLISGFGDAIASPFLLDTSSVLSTLLLFTCPIALINGEKLLSGGKSFID